MTLEIIQISVRSVHVIVRGLVCCVVLQSKDILSCLAVVSVYVFAYLSQLLLLVRGAELRSMLSKQC